MPFIDEMKIHAEAGTGGNGVVRWRQEKFIPKGGPAGGDAGRGGDFYILAVRNLNILSQYKAKKEFFAERGEDGGNKSLHGKNGEDFILELPIGSIITNLETNDTWQLTKEGEKILILKGGYGGYGNEHFKSSTNTTPQQSNKGEVGEKGDFQIELELFADLGLIGFPNAGKSSLLNSLTNAQAKIGDYPFTTLDPNLGNFYGYTIADIPGLIEDASSGKGLGIKFLKHIKRTKILAHLVAFPDKAGTVAVISQEIFTNYKIIRKELEKYDKKFNLNEGGLSAKKEIIILTKSDLIADKKTLEKIMKDLTEKISASKEKENLKKKIKSKLVRKSDLRTLEFFYISLFDDNLIKEFQKNLTKILKSIG
ncbi:MAG: GTPase ObgE [Patescibacteria group bacterium]